MGEEFYDDCQQIPERGKERRKEQGEQIIQKRKKYLRYAISSAFGKYFFGAQATKCMPVFAAPTISELPML